VKGRILTVIDLSTLPFEEQSLRTFLDRICETYGFDYAAYAGTNPIAQSVHGVVNYPRAWQEHYVAQGFERRDPVLLAAGRSIAPVDWQRLRDERSFKTVFAQARDFGVPDRGLTIPVRGPYGDAGLFSVTRACSDREWRMLKAEVMGALQNAAVHMHDTVVRSHALSRALMQPAMSSRETEILQWIAAGKTQQDVADILSISNRTVEVHLRSVRSKLGSLTTAQAVGRAIGLGLVHPQ
jgi:DNA-binding CsgD family transcriptional regulator